MEETTHQRFRFHSTAVKASIHFQMTLQGSEEQMLRTNSYSPTKQNIQDTMHLLMHATCSYRYGCQYPVNTIQLVLSLLLISQPTNCYEEIPFPHLYPHFYSDGKAYDVLWKTIPNMDTHNSGPITPDAPNGMEIFSDYGIISLPNKSSISETIDK